MVALDKVQASNARITKAYPEGLVAVFAGATAGIGEIALQDFAQHTTKPRIYIIGRSQEACDRLDADLKKLNPGGEYIFVRSDVSLIRNVDDVCAKIKSKETAINILFMSQGTLNFSKGLFTTPHQFLHMRYGGLFGPCYRIRRGLTQRTPLAVTEEGINYLMALTYFGRLRFVHNLIPLLQKTTGLRRVVSAFAGAKEGKVYPNAWQQGQESKVPLSAARGHSVTMSKNVSCFLLPSVKLPELHDVRRSCTSLGPAQFPRRDTR